MKINSCLALIICTFLLSCERYLDNVELPEFKQKLVLNSFLSPHDSISFISVKSNKKLYGALNQQEATGSLTGILSDGSREISLTKAANGFTFRKQDMLLEEGKKYTLNISSDKGLHARASTIIPVKREVKIEIDTSRVFYDYGINTGQGWWELRADIFLTDYEGEENFYSYAVRQVIYNSLYPWYPYDFSFYPMESTVFNDNNRDGKRLYVSTVNYSDVSDDDSSNLVVYILQTDREYYTYHHSMDRFTSSGDPFTEISPAYSNVEGGLGIMASYVVDSLVFRLK